MFLKRDCPRWWKSGASLLLGIFLATSGCTALTGESAGQYVDDSTLTARVKSNLVADKVANLTRVDVDTTNQIVSLNGIVESAEQKQRAEQLARQTSGVKGVKNNLQIQGKK
ncbi:MAG TPA: BON domain-containing protein [Candidatus Binatia bacterium]|jgi:osmotically-inducible protein OsmY|nr:BON domain-containing protein [Candidatus Binatia bacterium]